MGGNGRVVPGFFLIFNSPICSAIYQHYHFILFHLYSFLVTIFYSEEEGEMIEILNEVFSFCESNEIKLRFHTTYDYYFFQFQFFFFIFYCLM